MTTTVPEPTVTDAAGEYEQAMGDLAAGLFADRAPLARQQAAAGSGDLDAAGRALLEELGHLDFFSQAVPEAAGGLGLGWGASGRVAEAAGRELVPGLWLDQLVAVRALSVAGADAVAPFVSAEVVAALAFGATGADAPHRAASTRSISGTITGVRHATAADRWLLAVDGVVAVIDPTADGVGTPTPEPTVDPLWRSSSVVLDGVEPASVIPQGPDGAPDLATLASGLAASLAVGAASRALDIAVEYVKDRRQFGVAVGSFQAIKHRAANAYIDLLHSRSLARLAVAGADPAAVSAARIAVDHTYRQVAESALQMHGGVGFTSEVPIHLFLKNAQQLRGWPRAVDLELDAVRARLRLDEPTTEGASG